MDNFIQLKDVSYKVRNKEILVSINLTLKKSEILALTGPNGAGKTTLSKMIVGVLKATGGSVFIEGTPVEEMALFEVGRKIGYLFQNPTHQIFMPTVEEELGFAMKYSKIETSTIVESVSDMMTTFNLHGIKDNLTYHLSQGEKQRVALATILLNQPEYLILDEPFKGLDSSHKKELLDYLKSINKTGVGIMIITHDKDVIDALANRVILMKEGSLENDTSIRS